MKRARFLVAAQLGMTAVTAPIVLGVCGDGPDLPKEVAAWRAIGGGRNEWDQMPRTIADADNAALLYRQAFKIVERLTEAQQEGLSLFLPSPASGDPTLIAGVQEAVVLCRLAASRPNCVWEEAAYAKGPAGWPPEYFDGMLALAKVLVADAAFLERRSAMDDATMDLAALQALSRHWIDALPADQFGHPCSRQYSWGCSRSSSGTTN